MFPIVLSLTLCAAPPTLPSPDLVRVDFAARFKGFEACFALRELDAGWTLRYNEPRCKVRLTPCSTFKLFNALAGMEAGVVKPDTVFHWDGKPQPFKNWERDHDLASAIRHSVLWYFRKLAAEVGAERMQTYLDRCGYGNHDLSGGLTEFWINSSLVVSADEQLDFLERIYRDSLPFRRANVEELKKMMVRRQGAGWVFSGKTGSSRRDGPDRLGWFVGHVRSGQREFVFAANIHDDKEAWGPKAEELVFAILTDMGLVRDDQPVAAAP